MLKENSYIVYPNHGICQVLGMEKMKYGKKKIDTYILNCLSDNIRIRVPIDKEKTSGIRKIVSKKDAEEYIKYIQKKPNEIEANWKIRQQENSDKLSTGSVKDTIEVARGLFIRNRDKELSTSEKRLYEKAYSFIVEEFRLALKKDREYIEDLISTALEKSAKKFESSAKKKLESK